MPLTEIVKNNRINTKNIILPRAEHSESTTFDLRKDISSSDWERIISLQERYAQDDIFRFSWMAEAIHTLDPEKNLNFRDNHAIGEKLNQAYQARIEMTNGFIDPDAIAVTLALKRLFPQLFQKRINKINRRRLIKTKEYCIQDTIKHPSVLQKYQQQAIHLTRLTFPAEQTTPSIDAIKNVLIKYWSSLHEDINDGGNSNVEHLGLLGASIRKFYPEEGTLPISDFAWQKMRQLLKENKRNANYDQYMTHASNLAVLAADKILVKDSGVELIMSESNTAVHVPKVPLPTIRRF